MTTTCIPTTPPTDCYLIMNLIGDIEIGVQSPLNFVSLRDQTLSKDDFAWLISCPGCPLSESFGDCINDFIDIYISVTTEVGLPILPFDLCKGETFGLLVHFPWALGVNLPLVFPTSPDYTCCNNPTNMRAISKYNAQKNSIVIDGKQLMRLMTSQVRRKRRKA